MSKVTLTGCQCSLGGEDFMFMGYDKHETAGNHDEDNIASYPSYYLIMSVGGKQVMTRLHHETFETIAELHRQLNTMRYNESGRFGTTSKEVNVMSRWEMEIVK